MKRRALVMVAAVGASAFLAGCGKKFPEPWDKYEFTRDGLVSAFKDAHGMTAIYKKDREQAELVGDWDSKLKDKGYKRFCEHAFKDGSIARGYKKDADDRFLFTGGKLGTAGSELHLTEIPEKFPDDQVCVDPKGE